MARLPTCAGEFDGAQVRTHAMLLAIDHRFLLVTGEFGASRRLWDARCWNLYERVVAATSGGSG
jgi:hypothetical protein